MGIANMEKDQDIAIAENVANERTVEALETLEVGKANVQRQATVELATGEADAELVRGQKRAEVVKIEGVAEADVVAAKGKAEGEAIEAQGLAEALAKDKMADAMTKFNEAATGIEKIRAWIEVEKAKWGAHGKVAENAQIDVVQSGKGVSILGVPLNAEAGADLGQMLKGLDLGNIVDFFKGNKDESIDVEATE